jgi:peptidylprolyl isomerase
MADTADPENTLMMETSKGAVTIALRPDLAPNHVARIKELARDGFYDGIVFHRVIDGFMAQTGDPTGTGTGGSGKNLKADDARFLDGKYTVWGKVTAGMEAIDQIKRGEPVTDPDRIVSLKVAADA